MKIAKKIFRILGTIFLIFLIAVVILMFNARFSGKAPSIFGYQVFRVYTGSMAPQLEIGDVILVKETDFDEIKKGDIITYNGEEGDLKGKFITHKVVETPVYMDGEYTYTTRGIASSVTMNDPTVHQDQVLGVYVCTIPFINTIYNFFLEPYGLITFILVIVVLFAYELISLILSYHKLDEPDFENSDESEETLDNEQVETDSENESGDVLQEKEIE